jgi:hypothetical protein
MPATEIAMKSAVVRTVRERPMISDRAQRVLQPIEYQIAHIAPGTGLYTV